MTPEQDDKHLPSNPRTTPKWLAWWQRLGYGWRVTVGVVAYVVVAVPVVLFAPAGLLNNWVPEVAPDERSKLLGAAGNLVLLSLGGVIAVVTVGLSLSRHHQEKEAADRDRQRLSDDQKREQARLSEVDEQRQIETVRSLRERFVTTVQLLSDSAPINRQAALYALGALADDWAAFGNSNEVQVCIEVLTGYLRATRSEEMLEGLNAEEAHYTEPEDHYFIQRTTPVEVSVKQAGYAVLRNHLQPGASPGWHEHHLNLSRAHIDFPVELLRASLTNDGTLDLHDVWIGHTGSVDLGGLRIADGGRLRLNGAMISGRGTVDLGSATITDRSSIDLSDAVLWDQGSVDLGSSRVDGHSSVILRRAKVRGRASVNLLSAEVIDGGTIDLLGASISAAEGVNLSATVVRDGGSISFPEATIGDGGTLNLRRMEISAGCCLDFTKTMIGANGRVDLAGTTIDDGATVDLGALSVEPRGRLIKPNGMPSKRARARDV